MYVCSCISLLCCKENGYIKFMNCIFYSVCLLMLKKDSLRIFEVQNNK